MKKIDSLMRQLTEYPALAEAIRIKGSTPTIHIGMLEFDVSVYSQKSFAQKLDSFLQLVPDHEILKTKIGDYSKLVEETKQEVSGRIMKIQDIFESLVEALALEEAEKFNEKLHKLAKE